MSRTSQEPQVVVLTVERLDEILALEARCFVPALQARREVLRRRFTDGHTMFGVQADGALVALLSMRRADFTPSERVRFPETFRAYSTGPSRPEGNAAFLYNLEIAPAYSNGPSAQLLIEAAMDYAKESGCRYAVADARCASFATETGPGGARAAIDRYLAGGAFPTPEEFRRDPILSLYERLTGCTFLWVIPNFIPEDEGCPLRVIAFGDLDEWRAGAADRPEAGAARLQPETLEPRILLSATWVDADTGDLQETADADADIFTGSDGADVADALAGDDVLFGGGGADQLFGGEGDDTFLDSGDLSGDADTYSGGSGHDTISYADAGQGVQVDLTTGSGPGGDSFSGVEGVVGSQHDDTFAFAEPSDGAVYSVDGGGGENTLDLSGFDSSQVTFSEGRLTVALDDGGSFAIDYDSIDHVTFGDTTAEVLDGDASVSDFSGSKIFIDGDQAFQVTLSGPGSLDLSYDADGDALSVLDSDATSPNTSLAIHDLGGSDLAIESITLDSDFGSVHSDADIGTLQIGANTSIGTITVGDGGGTIDTLAWSGGTSSNSTWTIAGNVGQASATTFDGDLRIEGDLGTLDVTRLNGDLTITGNAGTIRVEADGIDDDLRGALTVHGNLDALEVGDDLEGSVEVHGNVGRISAADDFKGAGAIVIHGHAGTLEAGDAVTKDITVDGDLDSLRVGNNFSGRLTAGQVTGQFSIEDGGHSESGAYTNPVRIEYDGAANTLSVTYTESFAEAADGAVFQVAGTSGNDTLDLSTHGRDQVTFSYGRMVVANEDGTSFTIEHDGLETVLFGDTHVRFARWDGEAATADWSDPVNWSNDTVPGPNDILVFDGEADDHATFGAGLSEIGGLLVGDGYSGDIRFEAPMTINGPLDLHGGDVFAGDAGLTVSGDLHVAGGRFFAGSGVTTVGGSFEIEGGTFHHDNGTVRLIGDGAATFSADGMQFHNLDLARDGGSLTMSDSLTVRGDLTQSGAAVDATNAQIRFYGGATVTTEQFTFGDVTFDSSHITVDGPMDIDGDLTIDKLYSLNGDDVHVAGNVITTDTGYGGDGRIVLDGGGDQSISANGGAGELHDFVIDKSGGTVTLTDSIQFSGDVTVANGALDATGGSVMFQGSGTIDVGDSQFGDVTFYAGNVTLEGPLDVQGDLTITSLSQLNGGNVRVAGNIVTTDTSYSGDGRVVLTGGGDQSISANGGAGELHDFVIDKSGGTVTLTDSIQFSGDVTVASGALDATGGSVMFQGSGTIDVGDSQFGDVEFYAGNVTLTGPLDVQGDLTITSLSQLNGGDVRVAGNIVTTDTSYSGDGRVVLTGGGDQSISANGGSGELHDFVIDKSGGTVTLTDSIQFSGDVTVVNGALDATGGSVMFQGSGTIDVGDSQFGDVEFYAGNVTLTGPLDVQGDLTITSLSQLNGGEVRVAGNIVTTDTSYSGDGRVVLTGGGDQSISANGGSGELHDFVIDKSGGTVTLTDEIQFSGDVTVANGALDATGGSVMFQNSGTIDVGASQFGDVEFYAGNVTLTGPLDVHGDLTITSLSQLNGGDVRVAGNIVTTDTSYSGDGRVVLTGGGDQSISANGGSGELHDFVIDKSGGTVTLTDRIELSGDVTVLGGRVDASDATLVLQGNNNITAGGARFGDVELRTGTITLTGDMLVDGDLTVTSLSRLDGGTIYVSGDVEYVDTKFSGSGTIVTGVLVLDSATLDEVAAGETVTWRQTGGPTVALQGSESGTPFFVVPDSIRAETDLAFELQVSGPDGVTTETVQMTVDPSQRPAVDFGHSDSLQDGGAEGFNDVAGTWTLTDDGFRADSANGQNGISLVDVNDLPDRFEIDVTMTTADSGRYENGFVIFDYNGPNDFKFAGARDGADYWTIGHFDGDWNDLVTLNESIETGRPYELEVEISEGEVTLRVDGAELVQHDFGADLSGGQVGLGVENAETTFSDFTVTELETPAPQPPVGFPHTDSFADGVADGFNAESGFWRVTDDGYEVRSAGNGVSVVSFEGDLPDDFIVEVSFSTEEIGQYENGFVIFDYNGPDDFKFAGARDGADYWTIGHFDGEWNDLVTLNESISTGRAYDMRVEIDNGAVSLQIDGVDKVSHDFGTSVSNGQVGLGVENGKAVFRDFSVTDMQHAPTADAGADQVVDEDGIVRLNAGGSQDADAEDTLTYAWKQIDGPTVELQGGDGVSPTFASPDVSAPTVLTFEVAVSDGDETRTDTVSVTINPVNHGPTAAAGADQQVDEGQQVTLDAGGSSDPDSEDTLTYAWKQVDGPAVELSDTDAVRPTFTSPDVSAPTVLTFEVEVSDGDATRTDRVEITVNPVNHGPVAEAGLDQVVDEGGVVTLDASGSSDVDSEDELTFSWQQIDGPTVELSDAGAAQPTFTSPDVSVPTVLTFEVTVFDGEIARTDTVDVTVNPVNPVDPVDPVNHDPIARAGDDQVVEEGSRVTLDASGSSDVDSEDELTFTWRQVDGPTVELSDANASQPTFVSPDVRVKTVLTFEVEVFDGEATRTDVVEITVLPATPTGSTIPTTETEPTLTGFEPGIQDAEASFGEQSGGSDWVSGGSDDDWVRSTTADSTGTGGETEETDEVVADDATEPAAEDVPDPDRADDVADGDGAGETVTIRSRDDDAEDAPTGDGHNPDAADGRPVSDWDGTEELRVLDPTESIEGIEAALGYVPPEIESSVADAGGPRNEPLREIDVRVEIDPLPATPIQLPATGGPVAFDDVFDDVELDGDVDGEEGDEALNEDIRALDPEAQREEVAENARRSQPVSADPLTPTRDRVPGQNLVPETEEESGSEKKAREGGFWPMLWGLLRGRAGTNDARRRD